MRSLRLCRAKSYRTNTFRAAVLAALAGTGVVCAAEPGAGLTGASPASAPAPLTVPEPVATASAPATAPRVGPAPSTAPAPVVTPGVTAVQPFTATITGDRVYIRPTPGTQYYQLAQLKKDDTVTVVGTSTGWYQIVPPASVHCLIVKEYVEADADGKTGTVKAAAVNVRAGSTINPNRSDVVLTVVKRGAKLTIQGSTEIAGTQYFKIAPPEKAYVYVSSQFVRPAAGTVVTPVTRATVSATTTRPGESFIDLGPGPNGTRVTETATATPPVEATAVTRPAETPKIVVVAPQPTTVFAAGSSEKFSEINKRSVDELAKPILKQDAGSFIEEWKAFLRTENLSPWIRQASEERVKAFEKVLAAQKIARESKPDEALAAQRQALQTQYEKAMDAVKAAENSGPYLAEGTLETSTVVSGRYALVNPITRRVVAYVDPSSEIPLDKLLGQYIGVRGTGVSAKGADIRVIKVKNATLIAAPKLGGEKAGS